MNDILNEDERYLDDKQLFSNEHTTSYCLFTSILVFLRIKLHDLQIRI